MFHKIVLDLTEKYSFGRKISVAFSHEQRLTDEHQGWASAAQCLKTLKPCFRNQSTESFAGYAGKSIREARSNAFVQG